MANHRYKPPDPRSPLPELTQLLTPGVLGFYTHVECTELFARRPDHDCEFNVFTILVAEERTETEPPLASFLTSRPIRIKSLEGWSFGLRRHTIPVDALIPMLARLENGEGCELAGEKLEFGKLTTMPAQFAPPDNGAPVPWNKLLKNNFWSGSHLFEWSDRDKEALQPFFDEPPRLQELSAEVEKVIPLRLAAVSDRLGNLVLQVPVTVLVAQFQKLQAGDFQVEHAWHPKATPRALIASCGLEHDDILTGFSSAELGERITPLPMRSGRGLHRGFIWDEENRVLLAASGPGSFIEVIALNMRVPDPEPRVFSIKNADGSWDTRRVGLTAISTQNLIGDPRRDDNGGWTAKRMYTDQANRLAAERRFVQYRPGQGDDDTRHKRALDDLRALIGRYGEKGAWLWDPYLSARDILETLFYSPYQGVGLRGLTTPKGGAPEDIRKTLDECQSNWRGLKLEFRVQTGQAGWDFHDRFLIFPGGADEALAWSLGTSVNSLGKAHHILQKVDNAQLVVDAFTELWELLGGPDHLIWKKP
ncbi:MAG: VPA1262 family N-terminal domain-containing protein [Devosia sp.]|nr:VPA1262 family N-terminal domain-containing protein [Devosia sp.]